MKSKSAGEFFYLIFCLGCLKMSEKCLKWLIMLSNFKLMLELGNLNEKSG